MADPVFLARVMAASLVAVGLLIGACNGGNAPQTVAGQVAAHIGR